METTIFGPSEPLYNPADVLQTYTDSCAIKSQQLILETFGINIDEATLMREAYTMGWYIPNGGTPQGDVGKLLELHGVDTTSYTGANVYTLMNELAQGHQVIVGVDCNELWEPSIWEKLLDFLGMSGANHAVIVSNIDATDPEHLMVQVTDPGNGTIKCYPWETFHEAWQDSKCSLVATTSPVPEHSGFFESIGGMVDTVMGMPVGDWLGSFGDFIQDGIDLTVSVVDYLGAHPELLQAVATIGTELAPMLLAGPQTTGGMYCPSPLEGMFTEQPGCQTPDDGCAVPDCDNIF